MNFLGSSGIFTLVGVLVAICVILFLFAKKIK